MIAAVPEPDDLDQIAGLPQNFHAEQSVIGACLISARAIDDIIESGLRGEDFYRPAHETIWRSVLGMHQMNTPVDGLTLFEELRRTGELTAIGGAAYLHELEESTPSAANASYYARIVREQATLRRLVQAGQKIAQLGASVDGGDVAAIVNAAQAETAAVADRTFGNHGASMDQTIDSVLDSLESGGSPGLATGLPEVDGALVGGLRGLVTVAGRPGCGKTAFAVEVALRVSGRGGNVGVTTLERTPEDLTQVALSNLSKVAFSSLLRAPNPPLSDAQWRSVSKAAEDLRTRGLLFSQRGSATTAEIAADIRSMKRTRGTCDLWIVDYLGLLTAPDTRVSRQEQISRMTREMKMLNRNTGTPILLLAQLNREGAKAGREPQLTDLRDSGSIEQDSDAVLMLHRTETAQDVLTVLIPKNRRGPLAKFDVGFDGAYQTVGPRAWTPAGRVQ